MKLRAKIERFESLTGRRNVRLTFPKGVKPYVREVIIVRNIGPRPWTEGFTQNNNGESVVVYFGR